MEAEIRTVISITGAERGQIKFCDEGYKSRAYLIRDGEIVFKFRRYQDVDYSVEVQQLDYINSLNLGVATPKVGWQSETGEYLGLYGVKGEKIYAHKTKEEATGAKIGLALKKLHSAKPNSSEKMSVALELKNWQQRYNASRALMQNYFNKSEMNRLDEIMMQDLPHNLVTLGEKLVFSHGDLSEGNIIVNENNATGIIDWGESCYLDEAADFMDLESNVICEAMLENYQASKELRRKVKIRRQARPIFVFGDCVRKNAQNAERMMRLVRERALAGKWL